jgi:hypothetical protein
LLRLMAGDLAARRPRSALVDRARPCCPRTLALGHVETPLNGSAQHRAATTQTPRRPNGAGGGEERADQCRPPLATTDALFARNVECKVSNVLARFSVARSAPQVQCTPAGALHPGALHPPLGAWHRAKLLSMRLAQHHRAPPPKPRGGQRHWRGEESDYHAAAGALHPALR